MANLKNTKRKLQSKIEAVKKINDRPQESFDDVSDKYLNNVPDINGIVGKKIDALNGKINKKKENTKDIFSDMIDITSQFMGSDKNSKNNFCRSALYSFTSLLIDNISFPLILSLLDYALRLVVCCE